MLASPMYSMGTSQRGYQGKYDTKNYTPGPGTYHFKDEDITKPYILRWTVGQGPRSTSAGGDYPPGPGTYFDESIKTDKDRERERKKPNSRKPGKSFLGKYTQLDIRNNDAIAPNTYKPQKMYPSQPLYSFGYKPVPVNPSEVPGPGAYTSENDKSIKSARTTKIGTSKRAQTRDNGVPGPGQYINPKENEKIDTVMINTAPNWGFGTSKREGMHNSNIAGYPGPGQYPIKSSISGNRGIIIAEKSVDNNGKSASSLTPGPGAYAIIPDKVFRASAPSFSGVKYVCMS